MLFPTREPLPASVKQLKNLLKRNDLPPPMLDALAAIAESPDDCNLQSHYADLLDHDDHKFLAEYIRLFAQEDLGSVTADSDMFWQMRQRYLLLKTATLSSKSGRNSLGLDIAPSFYLFPLELPADWKGRFRLINAYLNFHHFCNLNDVGGRPDIGRLIRDCFGVQTKGAVRQFFVLAFGLSDVEYESVFRDPVVIGRQPVPGTWSVLESGEGDYLWTIATSDLHQTDPPITEFHHDFSGAGMDWVVGRRWDRLTTWLLDYVVTNNLGRQDSPKIGRKLLRRFKRGE